jgi:hypothetical protein
LIATSSEGIEAYSSELASGSADALVVHPKTTASGTTATTTSATFMTTATKTPSPASNDRVANNGTLGLNGNGAAPTICCNAELGIFAGIAGVLLTEL